MRQEQIRCDSCATEMFPPESEATYTQLLRVPLTLRAIPVMFGTKRGEVCSLECAQLWVASIYELLSATGERQKLVSSQSDGSVDGSQTAPDAGD